MALGGWPQRVMPLLPRNVWASVVVTAAVNVVLFCMCSACTGARGRGQRADRDLLASVIVLWFRMHLYYIVNERTIFCRV